MADWRRMRWLLVLCISLLLMGCGGSTTGADQGVPVQPVDTVVTGSPVAGKALLPPGFGLPLDSLRVQTAQGEVGLGPDGSFSTALPDDGPALVALISPDGKIVLLGFMQTPTTTGELSARSTAVALLYMALAGFTLPADQQAAALELVAEDATLANLTLAVTDSLARNPTALTDGDDALLAAVQAAQQDVIGRAQESSRAAAPLKTLLRQTTLTVEPTKSQSGAIAERDTDSGSVKVTNHFRRLAFLHVYKVSTTDSSGTIHPRRPYEAQNFDQPIMLPSIAAAQSVISTLVNLVGVDKQGQLTLNIPFVPTSVTLPASLFPLADSDKAASYMLVMDSPSVGKHPDPVWQTDSNFSEVDVEQLTKEHNDLMVDSFFVDIINPALAMALGVKGGFVASGYSKILVQGGAQVNSLSNLTAQIAAGTVQSWQSAALIFFGILAQNPELILQVAPNLTAEAGATRLLTGLSKANAVLGSIDLALGSIDLFLVTASLTSSNPSEQWQVEIRDDSLTIYTGQVALHKHFHYENPRGSDLEVIDYDAHVVVPLTFEKTQPGPGRVFSADMPLVSYSITGTRQLLNGGSLISSTPIEVRTTASPGHPLKNNGTGTLILDASGAGTLEISYSFPIVFNWESIGLPPNVDAEESGNPTFQVHLSGDTITVSSPGTPGLEPFAVSGFQASYTVQKDTKLGPPPAPPKSP